MRFLALEFFALIVFCASVCADPLPPQTIINNINSTIVPGVTGGITANQANPIFQSFTPFTNLWYDTNTGLVKVYNGSAWVPGSFGQVIGPSTTSVGDFSCWNNTSGTILTDCNVSGISYPVVNPSSYNFVGMGGTSPGVPFNANVCRHQIPWTDQNVNFCNDVIYQTSTDPSATEVIYLTGTPVAGHVITVNFIFGSLPIPVTYTVKTGDTLDNIVSGLIAAVQANPLLYNSPNSSAVYGGGYANNIPIGLILPAGSVSSGAPSIAFDYDSRKQLTMSYTVTGSGSPEVLQFNGGFYNTTYVNGGQTQGTVYQIPNAWDNAPVYNNARYVPGLTPPNGSYIFALNPSASTAGTTGAVPNIGYGTISDIVCSANPAALQSVWIIAGKGEGTVTNANSGVYIGGGVFSNFGGSPCNGSGGGVVDMGAGTFNAGDCYYIYNVDSLCGFGGLGAGSLTLTAATGHSMNFQSNGSIDIFQGQSTIQFLNSTNNSDIEIVHSGGYASKIYQNELAGTQLVSIGLQHASVEKYTITSDGASTFYITDQTHSAKGFQIDASGNVFVGEGGSTSSQMEMLAAGGIVAVNLPTSAGSGGLYLCIDSTGHEYKKSSCP